MENLFSGHIAAPGFVSTAQSMSESAKEEGETAGAEEKDPVSSDVSEERMKVHRGERYLHDIQLETMTRSTGKMKL